MTLAQPKSPKPLRETEAVVVSEINDDWLTETVQVEEDEQLDDYGVSEWQKVNTATSKEQLKSLLNDVDQKLVDLYTHRNNLENKQEKRSLQRLKKKIIDKLNDEESNE
jgi:succinate dehydrogenase flavin-adding protein (antitoxin of CptAB toxin-antitoxin module)